LAMRRLSIIDLERGQQPIHNEDRTIHLVFNGELYNYQALRSQLQAHGHDFRTNSDTEVVVHAYEQWGTACLDSFRGMFAFALWDETRNTWMLARIFAGLRPTVHVSSATGTFPSLGMTQTARGSRFGGSSVSCCATRCGLIL